MSASVMNFIDTKDKKCHFEAYLMITFSVRWLRRHALMDMVMKMLGFILIHNMTPAHDTGVMLQQ